MARRRGARSAGEIGIDWRAAALLGLISSTYSTIVSSLFAARIGRDALVDWMVVAAIPFRDPALAIHPSWSVIAGGIVFHQWADFSWAVLFFGLLGRWTARLDPWAIALVAAPWALFTSSLEWLLLVPIVPFRQPIFTLEQVYWLGLFVHLTSAMVYPIFPYVQDRVAGRAPARHRRFTAWWSAAGLAIVIILGTAAAFGARGREIAWQGDDPRFDQAFMRRMAAHHAQGVELATLAAARAQDAHLRALARLMAAAQNGEIRIFDQWWRSWFGGALPPVGEAEHRAMPGMLSMRQLRALRDAPAERFDRRFVAAMTVHHRGAISMADDALVHGRDIRIRIMAHAIRHEQTGEIALMHGATPSLGTVRIALSSLFGRPEDRGPARTPATQSPR